MTQVLDSADLAAAIVKQPAPVIFPDTAALLDVLRVPFREKLQKDIAASAVAAFNDASADPRRLWLVTTATVMGELESSRDKVRQELHDYIRSLNESVKRIVTVAKMVAPESKAPISDLSELLLEERISSILDRLVESASLFQGTTECEGKAVYRVRTARPPASRAKQQFRDCLIFEEFLELVDRLRKAEFTLPIVFITPNSKDYGPAPNGFPAIASDLQALNVQYAPHLSWARAKLRM